MKRGILVMFALIMLAGLSHADVTSKAVTVTPWGGLPTYINLDLQSPQLVAGIQGQINFDPSIFSNPQVSGGYGANGFTVMGNLVAPGNYRFVAYSNPSKAMLLIFTALEFRFSTASRLPVGGSRTITYTLEAASTTDGQSMANVNFADVNVVFQRNNAQDTWTLYR